MTFPNFAALTGSSGGTRLTDSTLWRAFFANPVVVRDLRAQMRGTKSYWYQGIYLLLLGILAIAGYGQSTGQTLLSLRYPAYTGATVSIVEAQSRLESFYYFIFMTLAGLICLIAPALTASSVVGERQRQSLDLLVTTPISATELLVGKLLSSVAFLGLLLALSLPASALCVLLGGATIVDVLRVYTLLAVDGIVLAGIGLFFSCAVRVPLLALAWTYGTVLAFLFASGFVFITTTNDPNALGNPTPLHSLVALNPFAAVFLSIKPSWSLLGLPVPVWLGTVVAAGLLLRLLLTAATYRFGIYGGSAGPSLRRQALFLSVLTAFVVGHGTAVTWYTGQYDSLWMIGVCLARIVVVGVLAAIPFLPGLFVPASPEDAPPGTTELGMPRDTGLYRIRRAFLPLQSGALPLFHLWLLLGSAALYLGEAWGISSLPSRTGFGENATTTVTLSLFLLAVGYASGVGFLFWSLSHLAARIVSRLTAARGVAFSLFLFFVAAPLLLIVFTQGEWKDSPFIWGWVFHPLLYLFESLFSVEQANLLYPALLGSSLVAYGLGAVAVFGNACIARKWSKPMEA